MISIIYHLEVSYIISLLADYYNNYLLILFFFKNHNNYNFYYTTEQQNDPHCFQSLSLDLVLEAQWGGRIHGNVFNYLLIATVLATEKFHQNLCINRCSCQMLDILVFFNSPKVLR